MNIFRLFIVFIFAFSAAFVNAAQKKEEAQKHNLSPTTVIKCVLSQKLISDYVGPFRGFVTHDTYDRDMVDVLIPKGSKVHGNVIRTGNVNEPISARVAYLIHTIETPDGELIDFKKDVAVDHEGVAAIEDEVDYHFMAQFLGVLAYAIVSSGVDGSQYNGLTGEVDVGAEIKGSLRDQFAPLASKYLRLVPTITINSGQTFNVFVTEPKYIKPYQGVFYGFNK